MSDITAQDLGSSLSVLEFLRDWATENHNIQMLEEVNLLINDYNSVMVEPDISDKTLLPYNRKDAYSILEYLKIQAEQLSNGRWTDFSDSDIGTIYLKLMSYISDMVNFQVDKTASELYLSTCTERVSALYLCSLIGYEPRHYMSAYCDLNLIYNSTSEDLANGTTVSAYSTFTDSTGTVMFSNIEDGYFYNNKCALKVYEGTPTYYSYGISNITSLGRIILPDYNIGVNTISLSIDGTKYNRVDDVRFTTNTLEFSVHIYEDQYLYIQLPSYWTDMITQGSVIEIRYLLSSGEDGRIGKNVLSKIEKLNMEDSTGITIYSNTATEGGYNPETVDEMKDSVPRQARTMNTIVTINDFEEVGLNVLGTADISALDYNDPASGLIQPDDYYKVYLYVLPEDDTKYDAYDTEALKYRNSIIKLREDWEVSDLENVAEALDIISKASVLGSTITLTNALNSYTVDDIVPSINTGLEETSWLIEKVSNVSGISDRIVYSIASSGNDIIITFNDNWRDFVDNSYEIYIYYKRDQILTDKGQTLREYIDERRLTSLNVTYHDLTIVHPEINVSIYMDQYDIHFDVVGDLVKDFILKKYSRDNLGIGDPIFASVIGSDILHEFNYIRYCEVVTPEEKIEVLPNGFIDVVPNIVQNGELVNLITVNVYDYQNRVI